MMHIKNENAIISQVKRQMRPLLSYYEINIRTTCSGKSNLSPPI